MTPNADATQWTLKLRPGVKFGDGNPLTATAVKLSISRHQNPANHSTVLSDVSQITNMNVVDDLTLVFTLAAPWGTFPHVLADLGGMIVDTTVVDKMGETAFNKYPRGAGVGPFEIVSFTPGESIIMEPKKDYWGGPVCIQQLKFVPSQTPQATFDALKLGQIQAAYVRDPLLVSMEKAANLVAYREEVGLGSILQINSGYNNPPTADVRLRQALAYAIDPKVIDQRVNAGTGIPTPDIMPKDSSIYPGVGGLAYDPVKAKQLVQAVKASGWNGKLVIVCPNNNDTGIVLQAQLQAVGIDATLDSVSQTVAIQRTITNHDYDVGCGGPSVSVAAPIVRLDRYFGAKNTFTGFRNDAFNAALLQLKAATTTPAIKVALAQVQQVWNTTVPSVGLGASEITIGAYKTVHGLVFNENATVYFGGAYIQ
jgi:peptide/nickel transport system substrate-binding protein